MQKLIFYSLYPLIWLLSKAPFPVLYAISDFLYLIIYYLIGYRKKLVLKNLRLAFPNKTDKELKDIRKKFYHHFVDMFLEMIKGFTISKEEIAKHFKFKNIEVIHELADRNRSAILLASHYGNWEWASQMSMYIKQEFVVTYAEIENKIFEDKIKATRERFGVKMILKKNTIKKMIQNTKDAVLSLYVLVSDQSPVLKRTYYWNNFLGVRVPIHTGAEMLAKKYDLAVVNVSVSKVKRGYYEAEFELITDKPRDFKDYEITDIYLKSVEKQIRDNPNYYFWTHNRFKHMGKENLGKDKVKL